MLKRALSIIVAIAILCTMAIFEFAAEAVSLSVEVSDADLRPGDKTTATVKLNNYADNWSAMSVDVKYDPSMFTLDAVRYNFLSTGANGADP